ncbi:MAG: DHH family phosphoesterase [Thermoplasmata archaeon]
MKCQPEAIREALRTGKRAILLHSNADMDCVGSAAALASFYGIDTIFAPAGVSHLGKRLLSAIGIETNSGLSTEGVENVILVDAQDDASLGYSGTPWDQATVIDHHRSKGTPKAARWIVDEGATSCCEIIWDIIGRPKEIAREIGLCLMAGMVADTGHLKRGGHRTFLVAAEILGASGLSMEEVLEVFESAEDQDISRRVSRLKGVQRMKYERNGDWVVAVTEIGAFESAVCHALLSTGADVAFAGSQKEDEFRITGRATTLATGVGIHLGEMFNRIAAECSGEGGGHDGAAGLSGTGDIEAMLGICLHNAVAELKGKKRKSRAHEENVL